MHSLTPAAIAIIIMVAAITLRYIGSCAIWPFITCRRCHGTGHTSGLLGAVRPCSRCRSSGLRLRLGRRIWNTIRHLFHDLNNH